MPIKGTRFLLTHKGGLAIDILKIVNEYLDRCINQKRGRAEVVEVLDWIAGEVVKDGES